MGKANEAIVSQLVQTARKILNHDAGDDEPQDLWEIGVLTREFRKILETHKSL